MLATQFSIGMDNALQQMERLSMSNNPKYPPYNIVTVSDTEFKIEVALAGFSKKDLTAEYKDSILTIKTKESKKEELEKDPEGYLYKGISHRPFVKEFQLAEDIEVGEFNFVNGLLTVDLIKHIPENKKRKEFVIK
jgi:molecular chaperone IbpA